MSDASTEGAVAERVLAYVASQLVDEADAVEIEASRREGVIDLRLSVSKDDMGRVIGRRGRNAQAIRTVVRAAGAREGIEATVDIID